MDIEEYENNQTKLQIATRDWILSGNPNCFVTLTFSSEAGVSYDYAKKVFGIFAYNLKCYLFGKKSKKRILLSPVIEGHNNKQMSTAQIGLREGTHIHCLMSLPENPLDYMEVVKRLWMASSDLCGNPDIYCPNNDDWFLELPTYSKRRIYTNYALKTCTVGTEAILWDFVPTRLLT